MANDFFSSGFEKVGGAVASLADASRSLAQRAGENIKVVRMAQLSLATVALSIASPAVVGERIILSTSGEIVAAESAVRAHLKKRPSDEEFGAALRRSLGGEDVLRQALKALAPKMEKRDQKKRLDELAKWRAS